MIGRSQRPVDAAVRFDTLKLRVAFEGRKPEDARLAVFVLDRLENADLAFHDRSASRETRSPRFDAPEFAGPPPEARLEVVNGDVPGVSGPLCLDRRHGAGREAELGCEGGTAHLDRADRIDGQFDRILAGHRISAVGAVEHQRALIAAGAADVQQTVRPADDSRDQRQRVLKPFARHRRGQHHARGEALDVGGDRALFDGVCAGGYADFLVERLEIEPQRHIRRLIRVRHDRLHRRLETLQFGDNRAGARGHVREPELSLFVRQVVPRFNTRAREHKRHAGHDDRLTVRGRQRHGSRDDARRRLRGG